MFIVVESVAAMPVTDLVQDKECDQYQQNYKYDENDYTQGNIEASH